MNHEELNGTYVLVNPGLSNDPVKRQGQIGMITYADTLNDDVYVSFEKGQQGLYSSDALLVMKKSNDVYQEAFQNVKLLDTADFKQMVQISFLQQSASRQDARSAIEMAAVNPVIRSFSMVSLKDQLGIAQNQAESYHHSGSIGR